MNKGIKRLGIIASVLWLTVGTGWLYILDDNNRKDSINFWYNSCLRNSDSPFIKNEKAEIAKAVCSDKLRTDLDELWASRLGRVGVAFLIAFVLNALGWLFLWIVIGLSRWVGAGFKQGRA